MTAIIVPLPLFALARPGSPTILFLNTGSKRLLPLFTSIENATDYGRRAGCDLPLVKLLDAQAVIDFVANPTQDPRYKPIDFDIAIDPIETKGKGNIMEITWVDFLSGLATLKKQRGE